MISTQALVLETKTLSHDILVKSQIESKENHTVELPFDIYGTAIAASGSYVEEGEAIFTIDGQDSQFTLVSMIHEYFQTTHRLQKAHSHLLLQQSLSNIEAISKNTYLEAVESYEKAQIEYLKQHNALEATLHYLPLSLQDVESLSHLSVMELANHIKVTIPQKITAPASGVITSENGTPFSKNSTQFKAHSIIATILNPNAFELKFYLNAQQMQRVEQNTDISIHIKGHKAPIKGVVTAVSQFPETHQNQKRYAVTCRFEADSTDENPIRIGMDAAITIPTDIEDRIMVPFKYVKNIFGQNMVSVKQDGIFVPRPVELGITQDGEIEITSGVEVGEEIFEHN